MLEAIVEEVETAIGSAVQIWPEAALRIVSFSGLPGGEAVCGDPDGHPGPRGEEDGLVAEGCGCVFCFGIHVENALSGASVAPGEDVRLPAAVGEQPGQGENDGSFSSSPGGERTDADHRPVKPASGEDASAAEPVFRGLHGRVERHQRAMPRGGARNSGVRGSGVRGSGVRGSWQDPLLSVFALHGWLYGTLVDASREKAG